MFVVLCFKLFGPDILKSLENNNRHWAYVNASKVVDVLNQAQGDGLSPEVLGVTSPIDAVRVIGRGLKYVVNGKEHFYTFDDPRLSGPDGEMVAEFIKIKKMPDGSIKITLSPE